MNASRVAVWIFGAAVLGAWLASAAGTSPQSEIIQTAPRTTTANPMDTTASEVHAQAQRLRQRLDAPPAPQTPIRNPFTFYVREHPAPRPVRVAAPVVVAAPVEPPEPALDLVGIAEKRTGDTVVRTALVANQGDVIMVTAGQRVLGIYEVVAVGQDAVELKHLTSGATRRLALR